MAEKIWQNSLIIATRAMINDLGSTPSYDDFRISQSIVVAGLITSQEFQFDTSYAFDLETPDITPDPVNTNDNPFIALTLLKTACLLTINNYQAAALNGIRIRSGDDELDLSKGFKGYEDIIKLGPCASYQKLLLHLQQQGSMGRGKAISAQGFSHPDFSLAARYGYIPFYNSFAFGR